jgi:hypothetical protein
MPARSLYGLPSRVRAPGRDRTFFKSVVYPSVHGIDRVKIPSSSTSREVNTRRSFMTVETTA